MHRRVPLLTVLVIATSGALTASPLSDAAEQPLTIIAPASPGGGWDQTARAMQGVLEASGLAASVKVTHRPGAGGGIALAEFLNGRRGDASTLLIGGLVMVNTLRANHATISLRDATPLARLTGDYQVIVVPNASPLRDLKDLIAAMRSGPETVTWAGGSYGGVDHMLIMLIAEAARVDPMRMSYVPFPGGGEALAALLAERFSAGVSGYAEFADDIRSGQLRALAVSSEHRVPGVETPTLREQGVDVTLVNWRAVFAAPDITAQERERLKALVGEMVRQDSWQAALDDHHWVDLYLTGSPFEQLLEDEETRAEEHRRKTAAYVNASGTSIWKGATGGAWSGVWVSWRTPGIISGAFALLSIAVLAGSYRRRQVEAAQARHRQQELSNSLRQAEEAARRSEEETRSLVRGLGEEIDKQFDAWGLTSAEHEVGLLMLKGLRLKEIAEIRNTSERTVRQQALTIYRKAGLQGRTNLAAFFLEDLLLPLDTRVTVRVTATS